eukprot:scaffold265698_cov26-Tisochrysis_lutea.AAC.2
MSRHTGVVFAPPEARPHDEWRDGAHPTRHLAPRPPHTARGRGTGGSLIHTLSLLPPPAPLLHVPRPWPPHITSTTCHHTPRTRGLLSLGGCWPRVRPWGYRRASMRTRQSQPLAATTHPLHSTNEA